MQPNHAQKISNNLKDRDNERLIKNFSPLNPNSTVFIKHSSEEGVIANGGRRGTRFAPDAILNIFKKLASHTANKFSEIDVSIPNEELVDFEQAQIKVSENIVENIKNHQKNIIFLGGGHDHVFSDLMAIQNLHSNKKIKVINLDPHLDMRVDDLKNSGTPFRQFDKFAKNRHELIQIGTLEYANVQTSLEPPTQISQKIIGMKELKDFTENFTNNSRFLSLQIPYDPNVVYFLSIDIDVIQASEMEAVSAVNYDGVPVQFIRETINYFSRELDCKYYGIYEYNPVFDNLSQKGARLINSLIYELVCN